MVLNCTLEEEPWFHHKLSRDEVNSLLIEQGDFLVRESKSQYILSMMWEGEKKHFIIVNKEVGESSSFASPLLRGIQSVRILHHVKNF